MIVYRIAAIGTELYQSMNSLKTLHTSPSQASYGLYFVRIWMKIDFVITAPHYIWYNKLSAYEGRYPDSN